MKQAVEHGYDWIFFTDDIFIVYPNVKQRLDLFRRIREEGIMTKWIVQMRADVTSKNRELIEEASKAGMSIAFLGIESGSLEILKKMHKGEFTPQSVDAVKILSDSGVVVLIRMMVGAPYERITDAISTIKFSRELARAGADAIQFLIYTPLPGTRVFDQAVRSSSLFTLDWDRYDVLTPVMRTRIGPVRDQLIQFYAYYSFYLYKFFRGKLLNLRVQEKKRKLIESGTDFIMKMMPAYLRDFFGSPRFLMETYDLYWKYKKNKSIDGSQMAEILQTSNSIVYDLDQSKNPYFMIKQNK